MPLLVLGSVAYDTIQTPFDRRDRILGGSGVYAACAASFFTDVNLVGVVGEDWRQSDTRFIEQFGVNTQGLETRKGAKTLYWSGKYFNNMNDRETLEIELNVMGENWDPIVPPSYQDVPFVLLANGSPSCHLALLEKVKTPKLVIADTMDFYINNMKDNLLKLMKKIDGLILNDSEVKLLTGSPNCISAGKAILEMGPKFVVVKKGEHGALYISPEEIYIVPAFPTENVVDPTGAGDSFVGALMGCLAKTGIEDTSKIKNALASAAVTAAFCCEGFSLEKLKTVSREQIEERLAALRKMCSF
ncbi:MAG: PfkB family carbohydrate kinase [Planctomycetia bacterium]|nr:PfkB family carbohydrate kinase [Planctomycetia bacterium]